MRKALVALLAVLLASVAAHGAHAQSRKPARDDIARARALDQQGAKAYQDGRYNDAIRYFEEAYRLGGPPFELWNVAKCHLRLDEPEQAAEMIEKYLATPDLPPDDRAEASQQLDELKKRPSTLTIASSPSGASVTIDGKPESGSTPMTVTVPPGQHDVALTLPSHVTYTKHVEAKYGRAVILDAALAQEEKPPPPPNPYEDDASRRIAARMDLGPVFPRYGSVGGDAAIGFFLSGTYRLNDGEPRLAVGGLFFVSPASWRNTVNAPTSVNGCSKALEGPLSATAISLYGIGTAGWDIVPRVRLSALGGVGVAGLVTSDVGGDVFIASCTTSPGLRPTLLLGGQVDVAITSAFRLTAMPLALQLQPAFAGTRTSPVDATGLWLSAAITIGIGVDL
ncbi:MAG TPA: PEGA domain-containing protein [Labilithrix sp.]